jgi:hypothetical protein
MIRSTACIFLFTLGTLAQTGGAITGKVVDLSGDPVVIKPRTRKPKPSTRPLPRRRVFTRSRSYQRGPTNFRSRP